MYVLLLSLLLALATISTCQTLPFIITGALTSAVAKPGTAINRGGTITIDGFTITIPDNLLVELPALFVPFAEFTTGVKPGQNEVSINGNIVNNQIIAGQMFYSQIDLAGSTGVIESLEFDGRIKILNGGTLRINDPNAVYSAGFNEVPFFTADDENPSITSFSGFPVCVPRSASDEKCPLSNRPAAGTNIVPDASHMVPLKVGDYIEFSGIQYQGQTLLYSLVANLDLLTTGNQPGFVRVEDALIGVADLDANFEAARHRFIGLASRSDMLVRIFAVDEDPCTGEESERLVASATPDGLYTRNYRIRIGDITLTTSDGIIAGQYVQPVSEWIFPELISPGAAPPTNDFSNIGPLRNGFGPINGTIFGQLSPWPGAVTPTPAVAVCAPPATSTTATTTPTGTPEPVALTISAGTDQTVLGGVSVLLSASLIAGNVPPASLSYNWTQIAGPIVALSASNTASIRFSAPVAAASREFKVEITHTPSGSKANDTIAVTSVAIGQGAFDHPVIDALSWASRQSGTATANAHTDLVDSTASMRVVFNGDNVERPMVRGQVANGQVTYAFSSRGIPRFTSATVRSYINNVLVGGPVVSSSNVAAG
ncbi:hypothetical protein GLAREA_02280 [Glarea lozoyensis ATCC 20868]|uniref:Uncharacterized protein n=1 Tax=Glarea lozoyensis (strain ATCC 20868 / MF5171) TaxID=1116229 RepID=S3DIJ4_GLAL2|nr:uncharacterized protein GLAREA_02280 [Glarea lozoyensis ATCC 20868]EPE26368.1 hypothetical protein GLAREA_02280 [Glarea lozoyensis ATCC 20868]